MICENTNDFINNLLPEDSLSAHGVSHSEWTPGPTI